MGAAGENRKNPGGDKKRPDRKKMPRNMRAKVTPAYLLAATNGA